MKRKILAVILVLVAALVCSGAVAAADNTSNSTGSTDQVLAQDQSTADSSAITPTTTSNSPDPYNTRTGISYTTIQAAVDDILTLDGDTIQVEDGYYPEDVYVWKMLKIVAENQYGATVNSFYINGAGSGSTINGFIVNGGTGNAITLDGVDGVKITNNWITGGYNDGVALINSDQIIISQNVIDDSDSANYCGIYLENSRYTDILRNYIANSIYDGLYLINSHYADIDSNIITENDDNGIELVESDNNYLSYNTIDYNLNGVSLYSNSDYNKIYGSTLNSNNNFGVYLDESDSNAIYDNTVEENFLSGIFLDESDYNDIYNNTIDSNKNEGGVRLSYSNFNEIYGNEIYNNNWGNIGTGVSLYESDFNEIYSNAISFHNGSGIVLSHSDFDYIYDNTIDLHYSGVAIIDSSNVSVFQNDITRSGYGVEILGSSTSVYITFNRIVDNSFALDYEGSGYVDATLNWWGYNEATDVDNQIDDSLGTGILVYDPWIVLSITANPASVGIGGISTITADLLHDSDGVYHYPVDDSDDVYYYPEDGLVPYRGPANFATTLGSIVDVNFGDGVATSTLNGLTTAGTAVVSSTVDYQTVSTNVVVYPVATIPEVISGAAYVKAYYELNHALPVNVILGIKTVTMPQFLYLLVTATRNINSGIMTSITIIAVNPPTATSGTYTPGNLYKTPYLTVANNIKNFIITNGRAPNYATTSLGKIPFSKLVYMYSKIINYYGTNARLPNYVGI